MASPSAASANLGGGDVELVARAREGNRDAFAEIVRRYQGIVCSLAYSSVGNFRLSEDIAQDTFIAAWNDLDKLREPGKLRGWLCGIARLTSLNARRNEAREPSALGKLEEEAPDTASTDESPAEAAIRHEESDLVWRALKSVPGDLREPLVLYYRENHSVRRVAEALELSEDAVKQRLARGRERLKAEVADLVENTLRRSAPGRSFTQHVMAALPATAFPGKIAASAALAGKAGMGLSAAVTAAGGTLLGLLGGYFGFRIGLDSARNEEERRIIRRMAQVVLGSAVAFIALVAVTVVVARVWGHPFWLGIALSTLATPVYGIVVAVAIVAGNRKLVRLRAGPVVDLAPWFEFKSRAALLGLPMVHVKLGGSHWGHLQPVKAWVAVGSVAHGALFAAGGVAIAPFAVGGLSVGLLSIGGCAAGAFAAGGIALGGLALGGEAVGWTAVGATAIAWKAALGGLAWAREIAQGGIAHAAHANDAVANAYFHAGSSVRWARRLSAGLPWLSLLSLWPIYAWCLLSRAKHSNKAQANS